MSSTSSPSRLTVFCLREIVEVGLNAMRATMSSPFDRPPWMPPDLHQSSRISQAHMMLFQLGKTNDDQFKATFRCTQAKLRNGSVQ
jgi:hypothetical protein